MADESEAIDVHLDAYPPAREAFDVWRSQATQLRADLARALAAYDESHAEHRAEVTRLFNEMSQLRADLARVTAERDAALEMHDEELTAARAETARLRDRVEALPALWERQASEYPPSAIGVGAQAAVNCCARELRKALTSDPEPTT
jgi:hypothetical protein